MNHFHRLHAECERALRDGQVNAVAKRLSTLNATRIPRKWRLPFANLCRRSGSVGLGLRILSPIVRSEIKELRESATAGELAEYAVLLQRCGAVEEGLKILESIDSKSHPDVLLSRAYCYFNTWQYAAAVPSLRDYIQVVGDDYRSFIGRVNLAAALLMCGQAAECRELLENNIEIATQRGHRRLLGNCYELSAQLYIQSNELDSAEIELGRAVEIFPATQGLDQLFVKKWQAVIESRRARSPGALLRFRALAQSHEEFEAVRDADFHALAIEMDRERYDHLYFGTPFQSYRDRIALLAPAEEPQSSYVFGNVNAVRFDVATGTLDGREILSFGGNPHKLLEILLRDFYRPSSVGAIFSQLYPTEHFNIFSSPGRVRQTIVRMREGFEASGFSIDIQNSLGGYRIPTRQPVAFQISIERQPVDRHLRLISRVRERFRERLNFTAKEAQSELGLSPASFLRFARSAIDNGQLEKFGAGPATVYYIRAA